MTRAARIREYKRKHPIATVAHLCAVFGCKAWVVNEALRCTTADLREQIAEAVDQLLEDEKLVSATSLPQFPRRKVKWRIEYLVRKKLIVQVGRSFGGVAWYRRTPDRDARIADLCDAIDRVRGIRKALREGLAMQRDAIQHRTRQASEYPSREATCPDGPGRGSNLQREVAA